MCAWVRVECHTDLISMEILKPTHQKRISVHTGAFLGMWSIIGEGGKREKSQSLKPKSVHAGESTLFLNLHGTWDENLELHDNLLLPFPLTSSSQCWFPLYISFFTSMGCLLVLAETNTSTAQIPLSRPACSLSDLLWRLAVDPNMQAVPLAAERIQLRWRDEGTQMLCRSLWLVWGPLVLLKPLVERDREQEYENKFPKMP